MCIHTTLAAISGHYPRSNAVPLMLDDPDV